MRKRTISLLLMLVALIGNTMAYDKGKLVERHIFRLMSPDDGDIGNGNFSIEWNGNSLVSISQTGAFGSQKVHKQTYLNWFDHSARFIIQTPGNWIMSKNDRTDLGFGLMNNGSGYDGFRITGLKAGDIVRFEYWKNDVTDQNNPPRFDNTNASFEGTQVNRNDGVYGTRDYVIVNDGDLDIQCPPRMLLTSVTITHATYKKATFNIEEVTKNGNTGYKYTLTGSGVLEEKRGAVPYITMRFGHDDDMTVVRDFGNGNYAASCIIDPDHNLDISDPSVRLTQNYKKRYQNQNGQYVRWQATENWYYNVGDENEQNAVKALAQNEVNFLKGQEFTVYETDNYWKEDKDWILERSRGYKWFDNFENIWPLYGTYFYFFPEVKGKLSVKFYCEGNGEHMPFWWKAQDGVVTDQFITGVNNATGTNIYEYNDIEVVRGGAYYLCANPTLIESEHPVVRLVSYEFIPDFKVEPLYKVVDNATTAVSAACTIKGGPYTDLTVDKNRKITINGEEAPEVKFLGNIKDATFSITTNGNDQVLNISNITYKEGADVNKGGAIVVNLHCTAGKATFVLTVAYSAEKAVMQVDADGYAQRVKDPDTQTNPNGKEVKRWDFYTNELALGQYKDGSGTYPSDEWKSSPQLYKEVHKFDGMTTDWMNTYADLTNEGKEPIFKSVYDMEGDNADMIQETEGLIFMTETNLIGLYNENEATGDMTSRDRYIGLMGTADWDFTNHHRKLIIPFLKAGDRVVMKLGTYGNVDNTVTTETATLKMTNALDAVGNPITGDYVIGGSGVNTGNDTNGGEDITDKSQPWGEYHFIVAADGTNVNNDFALEVKDAKLLKIYSIVIYKHDETILTENEVLGKNGKRQILNTTEYTTSDNVSVHLHYRGLDEPMNYTEDIVAKTGNLTDADVTPSQDETTKWYTYTVNKNSKKFGVFKARVGVQTIGEDYVTDYADLMIPVGYRETMTYPYTWDFTDLKKYVGSGISTTSGTGEGNELVVTEEDLKIWNEYGLRVTPEEWDGNIFVSGGQLYGGTTMFDETRGIGITHDNNNKVMTMTGTNADESGALAVGNGTIGFIVPQLDKSEAIYVRAKAVGDTKTAKYEVSDGTTTYTYNDANATAFSPIAAQDESGDVIFAMAMSDDLTKKCDVKLTFQGYEVKKIAVSDDFKQLSDKGWATESRGRIIDPELTSYMTGVPFENLVITSINYTDKTIGYEVVRTAPETEGTVIKKAELMPACTADGGSEAYILHNKNNAVVEILNGGFHLFVPDMHDYSVTTTTTGSESTTTIGGLKTAKDMSATLMKAQLNAGTVAREVNGYINFVLTDTWTHLKPDGTPYGRPETSEEAFYQVPKGGIYSYGHQGYLPVAKSEMANAPRFTFMFMGDDDTTGIDETIANFSEENGENATYYNLNGQKLNGRPTQRGIYIVNGKKVVKK